MCRDYGKTFDTVLNAQGPGELPESVDRTLGMYHQFQSETLRVHEQYLNHQTDNMATMLNTGSIENTPVADLAHVENAVPESIAPVITPVAPIVPVAPVGHVSTSAPVQTAATAMAIEPVAETDIGIDVVVDVDVDVEKINTVMMEVVAEKTGYPTEMLSLDMDMEADLGIESIKRVEIMGSVQERIAEVPELNPEDLAELRTLGEIVDYMKSKAESVGHSHAPDLHIVESADVESKSVETASAGHALLSLDKVQSVMMEVVAEKTGYPTEMLELEMDMEADLGIDSIKRVEILGAVQETIPDLPELNPEDLAELRTLV